jgi:NitT/TauT family transport system permease protein
MHWKIQKRNRAVSIRNWLPPVLTFAGFLLGWDLVVRLLGISPAILPPPGNVAAALAKNATQLVRHAGVTLLEAVLGFVLAVLFAVALATIFTFSKPAKRALYPYAIAMKAIPLIALAPLVVVWFGGDLASKIVLAAVISFFPVLVSATDGFRSTDPDAVDLMRSFSASRWKIFTKLQFPAALPQVFGGLKVASSFSVVGAVVAEFVGAQAGIGFLIKSSSYYLDTDLTFAAIFVSAVVGLIFFALIVFLQRIFLFWHRPVEDFEITTNQDDEPILT